MLRIYSNRWLLYVGLAALNSAAHTQIDQFAKSATELFKLVLGGEAWGTGYWGRERVFGWGAEDREGASGEGKWEGGTPIFSS